MVFLLTVCAFVSMAITPSPISALEGQNGQTSFGAGETRFSPLISSTGPVQNTILFLPLKIHAESETESLAATVDTAILQALSQREEFIVIERVRAMEEYDYRGTWPPALEAIEKGATLSGADYVATGSLTRVGDKISIDISVYDLIDSFVRVEDAADETFQGSLNRHKRLISPVFFFRRAETSENVSRIVEQMAEDIQKYANRKHTIESIMIKGNKRIDTGAIIRNVKSKSSDKYSKSALRNDLKSIFQMGYFDDVQVKTTDTAQGKKIVFEVKEKAVVGEIILKGLDKLQEDKVREVITIIKSSILNTKEVKKSAESIRKLYKEKGYYNVKVSPDISFAGEKENIVDVTFTIDEGKKILIKDIDFSGNHAFKDSKLRKLIATEEKGLFSFITDSGRLQQDVLDQDADRLAAFYHNEGFIDAAVAKPQIEQKGKWLYITFNIMEGKRYKVGAVDISGDLVDPKEKMLKLLKIQQEPYFSRQVLRQDVLTLTDHYAEQGYAFADIMPLTKIDSENLAVNLTFTIRKGSLVHVNRIHIKGNTTTRDKVIRREIDLNEGGLFKTSTLRESVQKLNRLEYFEEVNVIPEPALGENLMDINVEVKEKRTGTFSIGAGYSSVDKVMFNAQVSKDNLFGRGQKLALMADLSSTSTRFNLSFTDPYINDSRLLAGIDLYNQRREYTEYTRDSQGFKLRFGYPVWEKWKLFWSYGYDNTDLLDVDLENASQSILDSLDINETSAFTIGLSRDTRDRQYAPSTGSVYALNLEYAGGILGGDSAFTKVEGSSSWFFPLFWDTVFHPKIAAGYVKENSGGKLPTFEKFYLGGLRTIRGFDYNDISPRDPETGDRIGGDKMWYTNLEYIFPLKKDIGLRGVIFFDAGNVYAESEGWDFSKIKKSAGLGFRWLSPIGPLRLEWGYNLDPEEDEDQSNWDFSIGGAF